MTDRNDSPKVPIACSLTDGDARDRIERWRKLVRDARLTSVSHDDSVDAAFRNEPAVRIELDALVTAERQCCSFLKFAVRESGAELVLTITAGREEARNDLSLLVSSLGIV